MRAVNEDELGSLLELPVIRACQRKWNLGRAEHGPVFVGDPLEELYGELADALNYTDQLELEGYSSMETIRDRLFQCATEIRDLWLEKQGFRDECVYHLTRNEHA
ncbi:MAG: hypothetical protein KJZ84_24040 [Bryobacteraceae bacterium]|nr:hypothetical protein [Bryobacteraceae bacterium]